MLVRGSCVTVPASLDLERHCINQEQEGRCRYEGTWAHKKIGGPAQKRDEAPWDAGGRQQQSSAATADAMGFWVIGGIDESTRCARIGFYPFNVPRSQSCPGSSATRLLIAAVDLGLSPFRVQAGHEVSLCPGLGVDEDDFGDKGGMADDGLRS
jgi:hypothetical protein